MEDLYFCIKLSEAEHNFCEQKLKDECTRSGASLLYWRKLADGHVPMFREVRVKGTLPQLNEVKSFLRNQRWLDHVERNPWK